MARTNGENQWARWPGVAYQFPVQCWVGPHHSPVITGIARAGIDALIELAGGKTARGRTGALLCENPQVQDAVGRADAILNAGRTYPSAMIAECWRDLHTVGQTVTLAPEWYPIGARVYLGMEPGPRLR
jgi:hypothetical protein